MVILFAILGIAIGSFCNAAIWRIHEQSKVKSKKSKAQFSITHGRSMCPDCKHELAPFDLIPVVSWLLLGGRCRYCHKAISVQYPIVELLTGIIFAALYLHFIPTSIFAWVELLFWCGMSAALMILTIYDLYWMLLPDVLLLPLIAAAAVWDVIFALHMHSWAVLIHPLLAALAVGGAFYALAAVSRGRWMGGGDIKLVFLMGLLLGPTKTGVAMVLAFYSAAIISVGLLALRIKKRSDHIPFGPFLIAATLLSFLYGHQLISLYLKITDFSRLFL